MDTAANAASAELAAMRERVKAIRADLTASMLPSERLSAWRFGMAGASLQMADEALRMAAFWMAREEGK